MQSYHDPDSDEEDVHIVSRILAAAAATPRVDGSQTEEEKRSLRETEEKEELPEQPPPPPTEEKPKEGESHLLQFFLKYSKKKMNCIFL